jgi:ELWxxDGT repeat protein
VRSVVILCSRPRHGRTTVAHACNGAGGIDATGVVETGPACDVLPSRAGGTGLHTATLLAACAALAASAAWAMPEEPPTDGPAALVANINRTIDYSGGSAPYHFTAAGRFVYFIANDGEHRDGLWRTDGTTAGTLLLADLAAADDPNPWIGAPLPIGGDAVLVAAGGIIWRSDGTPAGTARLRDGDAYDLARVGDTIFFVEHGQLWTLDAAAGTAVPLTQFPEEGYASRPYAAGDQLLFTGCTPETGCEPWRSDGTAAGTALVRDIALGPAIGMPVYSYDPGTAVIGDVLYFVGNDGESGAELWRSDGTAAGTRRVRDIHNGPDDAFMVPYGQYDGFRPLFTVVGRTLFFVASDGRRGFELWRSDGTTNGTRIVDDLVPGSAGLFDCAATDSDCEPRRSELTTAVAGGHLFFTVRQPAGGSSHDGTTEVWRSDGTAAGTAMVVADDQQNVSALNPSLVAHRDRLFFTRAAYVHPRTALWALDAQATEPVLVAQVPGFSPLLHGSELGLVIVPWRDEPWWSDGTAAGTFLLRDIRGDDAGSHPLPLGAVGDALLLGADDGVHGFELWRSDSSAAGTTLVADIVPGAAGSNPTRGHGLDAGVLFVADDGIHGRELWYSDGTPSGTRLVRDIQAGATGALDASWAYDPLGAVLAGSLYFAADDGIHGTELWRSDGSSEGTALVADFAPGPASAHLSAITAWDDRVYLAVSTELGTRLWRTDGASVEPIVRLPSDPYELVVQGERAFFSAWGPDGEALWSVDRSGAPPVPVEMRAPYSLVDAGGALLGVQSYGGLWRLGYGALDLYEDVLGLQAFDRRTVFLTEGSYWQGRGIGTTGGSIETTGLLQRLEAVEEGVSNYECESPSFTRAGERAFFAAQAGDIGCELWALPIAVLSEVCVDDCPPPPTPTPTEPPPPPTPVCGDADCTQLIGGTASGARGETVSIDVSLRARREAVAGVQNDIRLSSNLRVAARSDGRPDCTVNPEIGKPASAFVFLPSNCRPGRTCTAVRALLLSLDDVAPIADGAVLYSCAVTIEPRAPLGELALRIEGVSASTSDGVDVRISAVDPVVTVLGQGDSGVIAAGDGCQVGPTATPWQWLGLLLLLLLKPPRRQA